MRVTIVGPVYPFRGGIAHFGGCLYKELVNQGVNTTLINFANQYPQLIFPGKSQYEKNGYFAGLPSERSLTPYNPFSFSPALAKIRKSKPDLVIFNYFIPLLSPAYTFLLKKLKKSNIRTVIVAHNVQAHEKWLLGSLLTKMMLKNAETIITLSDAVFTEAAILMKKKFPRLVKGFHPLYDFHNRNLYTKKTAKKALDIEKRKVILFFGYIKPYKGLDILLASFKHIKERHPDSLLLIVGEVYGDCRPYREMIDKTGHKEDIIFKNEYTTDVEIYFKAADVLALPYKDATQSGVVQVAYSMRTGVVVTPVGGLPEMVIPGSTGMVARSVGEKDFAEAVNHFLDSNQKRIVHNIEKYSSRYSWKNFAELVLRSTKVKHYR